MENTQAKRIVNALQDVVGRGEVPQGLDAVTKAISGDPTNHGRDVVSALKEIARGLNNVAEAIRELDSPSMH